MTTSTYPTATTERGKAVRYSSEVIADHRDEVLRALATADRFLVTDYADARKVADRYATGPRTVATELYAAKPAKVEAAIAANRQAREAIAEDRPYDALLATREMNTAYCGGQSQATLPEALADAHQAIWSAWRLAVAAAR